MIQNLTKLLLATAILSSNATYAMEAGGVDAGAARGDVGISGLTILYPGLTFPPLVLHTNFCTHSSFSSYSFEKQEIKSNGTVTNVINPDGTAIEISKRNYGDINAETVYSMRSGAWGTITKEFVDAMIGVSKTVACNSHPKDISNETLLGMAKSRFSDLLQREKFDDAFMMYELIKYLLPFEDATPSIRRVYRYVNTAVVRDDADGQSRAFTEALRQHVLAQTPAHIRTLCESGDTFTAETLLGKFKYFPGWLLTAFNLLILTWAWLVTVCHGLSQLVTGIPVTKGVLQSVKHKKKKMIYSLFQQYTFLFTFYIYNT
jgi:hypothetical protein